MILAYMCVQAPGALICVSPCKGPFWVHLGFPILGPFGVHLGSIWGPFGVWGLGSKFLASLSECLGCRVESFRGSISIQTRIRYLDKNQYLHKIQWGSRINVQTRMLFRQEFQFRLLKNVRAKRAKVSERSELRCGFSRRIW